MRSTTITTFLIGAMFGVLFITVAVHYSGQRMYVGFGCPSAPTSVAVALERRGLPACAEVEEHMLK